MTTSSEGFDSGTDVAPGGRLGNGANPHSGTGYSSGADTGRLPVNRFACLSFLVLFAAPVPVRAQQVPPPPPHDSLRGAVRVVDARARALEVTTGVGLALRVVRLQVPATVPVTARGAALPFTQLRSGDIVRVSYGARAGGYVAYTIERVGRMATGPDGAP